MRSCLAAIRVSVCLRCKQLYIVGWSFSWQWLNIISRTLPLCFLATWVATSVSTSCRARDAACRLFHDDQIAHIDSDRLPRQLLYINTASRSRCLCLPTLRLIATSKKPFRKTFCRTPWHVQWASLGIIGLLSPSDSVVRQSIWNNHCVLKLGHFHLHLL